MTDQPAVEAAGLKKYFGGVAVLDGVDLAVPAWSVFALLGRNGAGKPKPGKRQLFRDCPPRHALSLLPGLQTPFVHRGDDRADHRANRQHAGRRRPHPLSVALAPLTTSATASWPRIIASITSASIRGPGLYSA